MINLLPSQHKKELKQEKSWKIVLILSILFLIFLICLTLVLFFIKTFFSNQLIIQRSLFSQEEKRFQELQIQNLEERIIVTNQIFSKLGSFYRGQTNFTRILEKISQTLPPGIYLTNLSIIPFLEEKEEKSKEKILKQGLNISLSGFAPTREDLLKFKKNLEKEELFKEIHFPPLSWVKPTDINFSITFKIIQ